MNGKDNLCLFWKFAQLLGISVQMGIAKNPGLFLMKIYTIFTIFLMLLSPVVMLYTLILPAQPFDIYEALQIIHAISVLLMYFTILKSKSQLLKVRKLVNLFPSRKEPGLIFKFMYFLISSLIFMMLIYPVCTYLFLFPSSRAIWYRYISYFYTSILLFLVAPSILSSLFCAVCYQWIEAIAYVKYDLQTLKICSIDLRRMCIARNLLHKCRLLWSGTYVIRNTFSSFLFYALIKSTVVIFLTAFTLIIRKKLDVRTIEITFTIVVENFYFINTVYSASKIPDEMDDLSVTLKQIYEDIYFEERNKKQVISIRKQLKWMANKKPIVLTAGGWVDMRKSLILSIFGSLITYGLIITQYNPLN